MTWVAIGVAAASTVVSLYASKQAKKGSDKQAQLQEEAGRKRKEAADFEANVLDVNAVQSIASAQRNMIDVQRITRFAESRAQALAAASGGGATSPTALKIIGDIAKEGSYNAARALYQGEETARILRLQAFEKRQQGEFDVTTGSLSAEASRLKGEAQAYQSYGNALTAGGGLYSKYGGRGPTSTPPTDYFQFSGYDAAGGPAYG